MVGSAEIGETVMRALILRRVELIEEGARRHDYHRSRGPDVPALPTSLELRQAFFRGADATLRGDTEELISFKLWEDQRRSEKTTLVLRVLEGYCMKGAWPRDEGMIDIIREPAA